MQRDRSVSDLTDPQRDLLRVIGWYYNGVPIKHRERYQLGETAPPDLEVLFRVYHDTHPDVTGDWEETYRPAFERLVADGWTTQAMIARKTISWAPKRTARQYLDDTLDTTDSWAKYVRYPEYRGGLVGDLNESLTHRWGFEVARRAIKLLTNYRVSTLYPREGAQRRFDMHVVGEEDRHDRVAIEIFTDHNDLEAYINKYQYATEADRGVHYIFQSTELANRVLNLWVKTDDVECDIRNFPLDPTQRAFQHTKQYVRSSAANPDYPTPGVDVVETIYRLHTKNIKSQQ